MDTTQLTLLAAKVAEERAGRDNRPSRSDNPGHDTEYVELVVRHTGGEDVVVMTTAYLIGKHPDVTLPPRTLDKVACWAIAGQLGGPVANVAVGERTGENEHQWIAIADATEAAFCVLAGHAQPRCTWPADAPLCPDMGGDSADKNGG